MRKLAIAAGALGALCAVGLLGTWGRDRVEAARRRRDAEKQAAAMFVGYRDAFLEDHRALDAHPLAWIWTPPTGPGRDAGPVLNGRIPWTSSVVPGTFRLLERPGRGLEVSDELRATMPDDGWLRAPGAVPLPLEALSLLDSLRSFDRWDSASGPSPLVEFEGELLWSPEPRYDVLFTLLRARHAQGLIRGDTRAAILTGRAVARLCFSSGSEVAALFGVRILGLEQRVAAAARAAGQLIEDLDPIDEQTVARLNRVVVASPMPLSLLASPEAEALLPRIRAARCSTLGEAAFGALVARPFVEQELGDRLDRIRAALDDEPGCSLRWLRFRWDDPVDRSLPLALACIWSGRRVSGRPDDCDAATARWLLPYRGVTTDRVLGVEPPDWMRQYRDASER